MAAVKVLAKQLKELNDHPLFGISALPCDESDMTKWCGSLWFPEDSPYAGCHAHFCLDFPADYPSSSPNLQFKTDVNHTHVFGQSCCFSLLPDFRGYFEATNAPKSAYWNSARTVRNFLESFYQFLVFDVDRESHGKGEITSSMVNTVKATNLAFQCQKCGHSAAKHFPERPKVTQAESDSYQDSEVIKGEITPQQQAKMDLCCSVTRATIDNAVIGFGVKVEKLKFGTSITTDLYPLSYDAFHKDKIRLSAGGLAITHWLPFAVNEEHWAKALPLAKEAFAQISGANGFNVGQVLDVIGELWKNKAVEMMKGEEHASEKILLGFCAFHHILLHAAKSFPELEVEATKRVKNFISSPQNRNKKACPDFGRFLPVFLISQVLWEDNTHAGRVCVTELFARNAKWIIDKFKEMGDAKVSKNRAQISWEPSQVGLKLTCFQIRYILEVGRPFKTPQLDVNRKMLDDLYGRPTPKMVESFQQTTKKVQAIANYSEWFGAMGLGVPPPEVITQMLQDAVVASSKAGYHR
eukprot:TRINITY_DN9185_c0_g1_i1.p1 TRINITY_DN9185_c0_g1~~TRINITY_DN9185_c0_g1_i1.p1  ORF type:complete len:524 (-),score=154.75 TRINITY_DN9185_c0_g1_i1:25-1596(-)